MSSTHTIALRKDQLAVALHERDGMTHYRLAKLAGLQQSTISRVLRGESAPSTVFVASVLEALGMSFEELFVRVPHTPTSRAA